jgi:putative ABC transport system permease protein
VIRPGELVDLARDVRYALRSVRRHRGLTVVAVACMGVGIGVCTTLFNAVNPWLFRPLPYPQSQRLVGLRETSPLREGRPEEGDSLASAANYMDWRERSRSFESLGAFERSEANLATEDEPERVHAARVTTSLFPTLRIAPVLGRGFTRDEDEPGGRPVAILGHRLWQRRSGSEHGGLGGTIKLDGVVHAVVGVMPPGFAFPEYAELWTPLRLARAGAGRDARDLDVVARLADGVTVEQARSELGGIASALARERPDANRGRGAEVKPLLDWLTPPGVVVGLNLLLAAGLFVQLIACANVANLLLAKAVAQRQEIAMRVALGASRARLLRQFTVETVLVTGAGAGLGLLAGAWGVRRLMLATPVPPPFWVRLDLDSRAFVFVAAVTAVSALLVGLLPVLQAGALDLVDGLKAGSRGIAGGPGARTGRWLVVAELGLSLVLLVGAALMVQSFLRRQEVDPGFDARGVLTARLALSGDAYADGKVRAAFLEELARRLRARPDIDAAGVSNGLPFVDPQAGGWWARSFEVEGSPVEPERSPSATYYSVGAGYLEATGLRLRHGRLFRPEEQAEGRDVVVVSDDLALRMGQGAEAIGRRLRIAGGPWLTVVGVVQETREGGDMLLVGSKPRGQVYVPYRLDPWSQVSLVVRTSADPARLAGVLRETVRSLDPGLPLSSVFTLGDVRVRASWVAQMWGRMLAQVAAVALLLAALGVYGVVAHRVSQRTREIGIRMAMGATRGDVQRLVVRDGLWLALQAAAVGVAGALLTTRALASLLYGIAPHDPATLVACAGLLALAAAVASWAPARRASRVDPVVALRAE